MDCEEDYQEEAAIHVVPKKHRPQYIAPMSMNKYANLAKQRVIAPVVSNVLPFKEGCERNMQVFDSNIVKEKRGCSNKGLQTQKGVFKQKIDKHQSTRTSMSSGQKRKLFLVDEDHDLSSEDINEDPREHVPQDDENDKEGSEHNRQVFDTNVAKRYQSGATTMGELILNNKGLQTQKTVFKQKIDKHQSTRRSMSSGQKRKSFLVDEDRDLSDEDINKDPKEHVPLDDENEEIDMIFENARNDIRDDVTSPDSDQAHRLEDGAEDVMDDETEHMIFKKVQNGSDEDASEDDLENDDYELVPRQDEGPHLEKEAAIYTNKKRGPTMMHGVHTRKFDQREVILCNEFGQPIGPVIEGKDIVGEFSRFLGSIARMYSYAPLTYKSWHKVPHKDKMWDYVLEKYIVPDGAKEWVLMTIGCCWRGYKCRIKREHFYKHKDNKTRWKNRPKSIPEKDFSDLLRLWNKKEVMNRCLRARNIRMSQKNMHTAGPRSFARIREEMTNEDPNKEPPTLSQMFERTRKRKEGNVYAETYDDTAKKVEQMRNYKPLEDGSTPVDPFHVVMGKEYDGHRRLYGRGVTNKLIKKNGGETTCMVPREYMDSLKALEAKERHLVEMGNKLEEEHERKKIELEEFHERKKAEFQAMQDKVVEVAMQKLIEKLPPGVARDFFTN